MQPLFIVLSTIFINLSLMGQTSECYTLETALQNKDKVESIYLNYSFQEIKPISDSIELLTNLNEFRIMPRMFDFPKIMDDTIIGRSFTGSEHESPRMLPSGLMHCKSLKLIDISNTQIQELPSNFENLQNLETLILNWSDVRLDREIEKILSLPNLTEIQVAGLEIAPNILQKLKAKKDLKIMSEMKDFQFKYPEDQRVDLQFHDTYIVFPSDTAANKFINSMPLELRNSFKAYRKDDR